MKFLRFFIFLGLLTTSCNIINKDEETPSFIQIDNIIVNPSDLGAENHNVSDVWLSVNGEFVGVFEVPTIIPILAQGEVEINISAGVKNNGMISDRIDYPLTENFVTTLNILPEETIILEPVFTYFDDLELDDASEDFGGAAVGFEANTGDFARIDDPTLDSSPLTDIQVCRLLPNIDEYNVEITTSEPIPTITLGPTMLEFNYKANQNFVVGIKSVPPGDPVEKQILIGLNTTYDDDGELEWKKIYINLEAQMDLLHAQNRSQYWLYFSSETEIDDPIIYLDNIKIIHLEE